MARTTAAVRLLAGDKEPVRLATTANIALAGLLTIDGVVCAAGDRVLVKDQTAATENGIYTASEGTWYRAPDSGSDRLMVRGMRVTVQEGATHAGDIWMLDTDRPDIGEDDIEWTFFLSNDVVGDLNQAAEDLAVATAYLATIGNQAYTFETVAQAAAATIPTGVNGFRVLGYYAVGDAPTASYYRVASQPSTADKLRTTDRFLPNGSVDASNGGWWRLTLEDLNDVRKFGVKADGLTDCTTLLQGAITACNVVIPAGSSNYILSADITIPSNRHIWVQKGATIINTGGRFTAYLPGGGNVHFQIDGVIGFLSTTTASGIGDWPQAVNNVHRGLIEMGGTHASPATNFKVTSSGGRVYSDYVWSGVPVSGFTAAQLNRKGITFINAAHCLCDGLEVDHIHGEAVYFNGFENHYDIKFLNNYVHHCAFNGLNFNTSLAYQGLLAQGNHIEYVCQGIEMSGGTADNNYIETCYKGIMFGGGSGVGPVVVTNNTVVSAVSVAYDLEFSPSTPVTSVLASGNSAISTGGNGFIVNSVRGGQFKNNYSYNHATATAGVSFNIASDTAGMHCDGNMTKSPGANSTGSFSNNAGAANTIGTNPSYA